MGGDDAMDLEIQRAQQQAELLRSVVAPLEEEIADLKKQLNARDGSTTRGSSTKDGGDGSSADAVAPSDPAAANQVAALTEAVKVLEADKVDLEKKAADVEGKYREVHG